MRGSVTVQHPTNWRGVAIKLLALFVLVVVTNFGFFDRMKLLFHAERWFTMVFYIGIWGTSICALIIASLQPNNLVRLAWAVLLSISTSAAYMYTSISGSDLSVFDALSLWTARHEAGRAFDFYQSGLVLSALVFISSFVIIAAPLVPNHRWVKFGLKWLSWTPAVPVLLIAAIIMIKNGGGSQSLPSQFQPWAISLVTAEKIAAQKVVPRAGVTIPITEKRAVKHIVMLVDESVRADYLFWKNNNPYTPHLAANKKNIQNFGQSVSGGNCSSYSNAILRFGPIQADLANTARTNPTIFELAKKAGYRTVFIDGQSGFIKDAGLLQNFMTVAETNSIDRIVRFNGTPAPELDFKLLEVIGEELKSDNPVFIYANKNGAHFPYDEGYPKSQTKFHPTITEANQDTTKTRVNSYLNVLAWSVDKFFAKLFDQINLDDALVIYTSDHGQALKHGKLTHCSVVNADPREGLVPMFAITKNKDLRLLFADAAKLNYNHSSHFLIRPTILALMGYDKVQIKHKYGISLFEKNTTPSRFSSGDIFGVFRDTVNWTKINLRADFREFKELPKPAPGPVATKIVGPRTVPE